MVDNIAKDLFYKYAQQDTDYTGRTIGGLAGAGVGIAGGNLLSHYLNNGYIRDNLKRVTDNYWNTVGKNTYVGLSNDRIDELQKHIDNYNSHEPKIQKMLEKPSSLFGSKLLKEQHGAMSDFNILTSLIDKFTGSKLHDKYKNKIDNIHKGVKTRILAPIIGVGLAGSAGGALLGNYLSNRGQ